MSSWFSGAFAKDYDAYYADTFPQRENFVSVATKLEQMRGLHPDDVRIHQASTPQTGIDQQKPAQQPQQQESQQQIDYDSYTDPNAPGNGLSGNGSAGNRWEAYSCIRIWECRFSAPARPCPSAMPR